MSLAFLVTTLVVVATPGTGVVYSVNVGLSRGTRAGVIAAVGCTLGVLPHMLAAITGLAALLHNSATAFQALKWAGIAYLLYLAWLTVRDDSAVDLDDEAAPGSSAQVIRTAILINVLNPKLTIFFFAFLPQFVPDTAPHATWQMLGLSSVFMAVTLIVFAAYGSFAAAMRTSVLRRPTVLMWSRRVFAGTYLALAARLALQTR